MSLPMPVATLEYVLSTRPLHDELELSFLRSEGEISTCNLEFITSVSKIPRARPQKIENLSFMEVQAKSISKFR